MTATLKPTLPPVPHRIAALPIDPVRLLPVPWFVQWIDGKPEWRVADGERFRRAINEKLCWVCGQKLGANLAFILGPMCAVNRVSAEPPCHRDCAEFSVKACPFLSRPAMERREGNFLCEGKSAGHMIERNPGVTIVWMTRKYGLIDDGRGGVLCKVGDPDEVKAWAEGRQATKEEVAASFDSGLPLLMKMAEGQDAVAELNKLAATAKKLLGLV